MIPDVAFGSFNFAVDDTEWIAQRAGVRALVDAILSTDLGADIAFAGVQGATQPTRSVADIYARIATGTSEVFSLIQSEKRISFLLTVTPLALGVEIRCRDAELRARQRTILDDVLAVPRAIHRARCVGGLRIGFVAPIVSARASYAYPRPRPPRRHVAINLGAIVDLVDRPWQRTKGDEDARQILAMTEGELPAPARRLEKDGLTELRWAESFEDRAALDRGCLAHEEWLGRHLTTRIDPPYDERGDAAEPMRGLEARAGLTRYDPRGKIAYVAVVILPDGEPEEHYWASALELVKKRATSDGAPVEKVRLIVPLRRLALAFTARAKEHGIDAVLYPGEDGRWWNPDPPGDWAYPPRA